MLAKGKANPKMEGAVVATLRRVGLTDRDRIAWIVGAVQKPLDEMPPGERSDLRLSLSLYAFQDPHPGWETDLTLNSWRDSKAEDWWAVQHRLADEEFEGTLSYLKEILRTAARHERITKPSRVREEYLGWSEESGRFYIGHDHGVRSFKESARIALWRQLVTCGHLLKECPAPAKRGKNGQRCGLLFVAKRPNQDYCGATCQGRANMRAFRAGSGKTKVHRRQ